MGADVVADCEAKVLVLTVAKVDADPLELREVNADVLSRERLMIRHSRTSVEEDSVLVTLWLAKVNQDSWGWWRG